jgi:hypothetical protein
MVLQNVVIALDLREQVYPLRRIFPDDDACHATRGRFRGSRGRSGPLSHQSAGFAVWLRGAQTRLRFSGGHRSKIGDWRAETQRGGSTRAGHARSFNGCWPPR